MEIEDRKRLSVKAITEMHRLTQAECSAFLDSGPDELRPLRQRLLDLRFLAVHAFMERHRLEIQLKGKISHHPEQVELTRMLLRDNEARCDELVEEICDLEDELRASTCEFEAKGYSLAIRSEVVEIISEREEALLQFQLTGCLPEGLASDEPEAGGESEIEYTRVFSQMTIGVDIDEGIEAIRAKYAERLAAWKNYR